MKNACGSAFDESVWGAGVGFVVDGNAVEEEVDSITSEDTDPTSEVIGFTTSEEVVITGSASEATTDSDSPESKLPSETTTSFRGRANIPVSLLQFSHSDEEPSGIEPSGGDSHSCCSSDIPRTTHLIASLRIHERTVNGSLCIEGDGIRLEYIRRNEHVLIHRLETQRNNTDDKNSLGHRLPVTHKSLLHSQ